LQLDRSGHTLQEIVLETSNIDALRSAKDEVKERNAQDIFNAEDCNFRIILPVRLDWIGRLDAKFRKQTLGPSAGIDQSEQWSATFVRRVVYDDRDLLTQGELFWLIHPDIAKQLQRSRWFSLLKAGQVDLAHHSSRYLKVKAMQGDWINAVLRAWIHLVKESKFMPSTSLASPPWRGRPTGADGWETEARGRYGTATG